MNVRRIALATACILLVPLVAMQFTDEVAWGPFDFIVAGVLLFGTGVMLDVAARTIRPLRYRIAALGAVAAALLVVWVDLAAGIVGDDESPLSFVFVAFLAIVAAGVVIASPRRRRRPVPPGDPTAP